MGFPVQGQTIYGGWTQKSESSADLETRLATRGGVVATEYPYNADPTGVLDATAAILAAAAAVQAAGGGYLKLKGTFKVSGVPAATPGPALFTFTNVTGLVIDMREAIISDVSVYAGSNELILFDFINCRDVDIRGRVASEIEVTTVAGTTHARGLVVSRFKQGCKNVFVDLDITGCKAGVNPTRAFNDPVGYRSSQFRGRIIAGGCYYPWLCQFSGDDAELSIDTDTCGRSFYLYGTSNQRLNVRVKNQQVTSLVWAFNGFGCRDIRIDFADQTSDANQAAAPRIQFGWADSTPATHANIDLRVDVKNPAASPFGSTFEFIKYSDGGTTPDAVGRGHVLDGFRLSGNSDQQPGVSHVTVGAGAWAAPDVCRNFAVRDFTGLGATSPISFGATSPVSQLSGRAVFENSSCQHNIYMFNGANGEVVFVGCQALNFSSATTDTDVHTLIGCNATDGTFQSIINKTFSRTLVGTLLRSDFLTPGRHELVASKQLAGDITGAAQSIFKLSPAIGTGVLFRLKYFLVKDQGDFSGTRQEVQGIKSFSATMDGAGGWTIQEAVVNEVAERTIGAGPAVLTVSLVNGDATGASIAVTATNYNNANGKHTFILEAIPMTPNARLIAL